MLSKFKPVFEKILLNISILSLICVLVGCGGDAVFDEPQADEQNNIPEEIQDDSTPVPEEDASDQDDSIPVPEEDTSDQDDSTPVPEEDASDQDDSMPLPEEDASPVPPVAMIVADDLTGVAPLLVSFSGSSSSDDSGITSFHWDFGDGTSAFGMSKSHTFVDAGSYTITLTVRDVDGLSDTATINVNVEESPPDDTDNTIDISTVYSDNCATCHGENGEGGEGPALTNPLSREDLIMEIAAKSARGYPEPDCGSIDDCDSALADYILENFASIDDDVDDNNGGSDSEGRVPMFVAAGWHGRRIMSCDLGRTWIADQIDGNPGEVDDWHRPYTPRNLAYGDGTFVFLTGWGQNGQVLVSQNGIDWEKRPMPSFYGGVGYDDGRFIVVGNIGAIQVSDDRGDTWEGDYSVPQPSNMRAASVFDGVWVAGADGIVETYLSDGVWRRLNSCEGARHGSLGLSGGFAAGLGILVSVGDNGDTCALDIVSGEDLGAGRIGTNVSGRPTFDGDTIVVSSGNSLYRTIDGISWTSHSLPTGVAFDLIARAESGTYVGIREGGTYYYSDDGEQWFRGTGPEGEWFTDLVFGWGMPSEQCPIPE